MAEGIQCCFERYERKYRLTKAQQRIILNGMRNHMKSDNYGRYTICNIYYDTDDWRLVRASIEKPVYKEKLRVRSYGVQDDDGKVFVELKKDFLDGEIPGSSFGQIGREIEWFQSFYSAVPKVFIGYDRLAFAGIEQPELRITFDTDIRYRTTELDLRLGDHGALILGRKSSKCNKNLARSFPT